MRIDDRSLGAFQSWQALLPSMSFCHRLSPAGDRQIDVGIALQIILKRVQCLSLLALRQAEINHLTLHLQAFASGVVFCDLTERRSLAGFFGTQGRFALLCEIDFCGPTGLERLAETSGTRDKFAPRCDIDFCEPTGLERLPGSSGTQGRFALRCVLFFCDSTGLERLPGFSGTQGKFALRCDIDSCETTELERLAGSSGT